MDYEYEVNLIINKNNLKNVNIDYIDNKGNIMGICKYYNKTFNSEWYNDKEDIIKEIYRFIWVFLKNNPYGFNDCSYFLISMIKYYSNQINTDDKDKIKQINEFLNNFNNVYSNVYNAELYKKFIYPFNF